MKQIVTYITMCLMAFVSLAQNKAEIKVSYSMTSPNMRNGKSEVKNQYILLANSSESKFYSPKTEYIDSLNSTPEGKAIYQEMTRNAYLGGKMDELPQKDGNCYIVKSFIENKVRHYDSAGLDKFVYEETPENGTGTSWTQLRKFWDMSVLKRLQIFMVANGRCGSPLKFRYKTAHGNSTDFRD